MLLLKLSPKARQDIVDILRYTGETWGKDQLLVYRDKINDALEALSYTPELGHSRNDLPSTYLAYPVGSHIIVYRIRTGSIGIVRILHQRMSVARHV
jgi:toxin ParE1/3/4